MILKFIQKNNFLGLRTFWKKKIRVMSGDSFYQMLQGTGVNRKVPARGDIKSMAYNSRSGAFPNIYTVSVHCECAISKQQETTDYSINTVSTTSQSFR